MLRKITLALAIAATAALAPAYTFKDSAGSTISYYGSTINDGELTTCFETASPVYDGRAALNNGARYWAVWTTGLTITSLGRCSSAGANIRVYWGDIGFTNCTSDKAAITSNPGTTTAGQRAIYFNPYCSWYFGDSTPVPAGMYDAKTAMAHEVGHALGLGHSFDGTLMEATINCGFGTRANKPAADDAAGARARYPGLNTNGAGFPAAIACVD